MKVLKLVMIVLALLITSGCAASKGMVKDNPNKVMDAYLKGISSGRADSVDYIRENFRINEAFGYVKPYAPVVKPADVRLVWIPAHKSENSAEVLVSGHWVYLMVEPSGWFIDTQKEDKAKIPLIVPYKQENKK